MSSSPSHKTSMPIPENNVLDTSFGKEHHNEMTDHLMHYLTTPTRRTRTISE